MARKSAEGAADRADMVQWLFDNSRDLMHVMDRAGRFQLVNPAWQQLTGLTEAQLLAASITELLHPDDAQLVAAKLADLKAGDFCETEVRIRTADGDYAWFAGRCSAMDDGRRIVSMRDASGQRAHREDVQEAQRTRRMLGMAARIGIWGFEPETRRIWWSDELCLLLGLAPGAVSSAEDVKRLMHPDDEDRVRACFDRCVLTGEPAQIDYRMRGPDGWRVLRTTVHTEARPGGVYALRGISQDITELAEARDAARRGERLARKARREALANARRLKLALEAANAGVYEIDHVAKTFWASPEFERLTGKRGASYEDALHLDYPGFHKDDLPHVRESFRALHRGDKSSGESFEARIVRPDGERWVRVYHHLKVGRNGRWLKAVGLVQDCDARKRQELALREAQLAAEAGAEAKSAFLANMSHEIRTPLNGVMGVLHLLKAEKLTEDGRGLLEEALSCGQMLGELLNDVIDFSKIEAGRLELACEPVDPEALVQGVARLLAPQAQAKGLDVRVEADPGLGWVRSDPVRLRQALFNLMGNAVKFTAAGRVTVRCRRAPGRLRFEVEDTGVGIPKSAQARLFQRFNQGDASTTRRFGGSGLGLAITKRLAEMMGGQVGFTSVEGQGSTFWFEIAAEAAEAQVTSEAAPLPVLEGLKVLVVEDNATNRLIATKLLENLGADVQTAADGYLGVEAAAAASFDLILMDVQMPGIDGLEAARRIRALGGPAAATPIVALTANVLAHQRREYLAAGMDGVVGKPIAPAVLLAEIAGLGTRESKVAEAAA